MINDCIDANQNRIVHRSHPANIRARNEVALRERVPVCHYRAFFAAEDEVSAVWTSDAPTE